jgi:hypothetical protein
VAAGARARGRQAKGAETPYLVTVGAERCRERFLHLRRPMFHRLYLHGDTVVAHPRPGTKSAGRVAFELSDGREVDLATLSARGAAEDGEQPRLEYLSSPVGRGQSELHLFVGSASAPWRTLTLPDAISAVADAPFGWYVGCRDGFLYALDRAGALRWRWQTPGAASFQASGPGEAYFRPCPYRLAANGHSALVGWFGNLWSVGPDGVTEWGLHLQELSPPHVTGVRLRSVRSGEDAAAAALGIRAHAAPEEIKRAYRRTVKHAHPDLHPEDASAAARFRRLHEAYEALLGERGARSNGVGGGRLRFSFPSTAIVSFLAALDEDWLVGASDGTLFRLTSEGRLLARVRIGSGALFCLRDASDQVVAFCSYPLAVNSEPNLRFVDADEPVSLPDRYRWPDFLRCSYGSYLLSHRPRGRDLALIDESGRLAVELRCPRAITSFAIAEGVLVLAAGALICLEIDGLSPLTRKRIWRPSFTRDGSHQPTNSGVPTAG